MRWLMLVVLFLPHLATIGILVLLHVMEHRRNQPVLANVTVRRQEDER